MRANEACSNAAKALHTCMAGSKGNVKASKSSVSYFIRGSSIGYSLLVSGY
jgi:hypothetical protein